MRPESNGLAGPTRPSIDVEPDAAEAESQAAAFFPVSSVFHTRTFSDAL